MPTKFRFEPQRRPHAFRWLDPLGYSECERCGMRNTWPGASSACIGTACEIPDGPARPKMRATLKKKRLAKLREARA